MSSQYATSELPPPAFDSVLVGSRRTSMVRRLSRRPVALGALAVIFAWVVVAVAWPVIVPYDPDKIDLAQRFAAPSVHHWFGADDFGRDILSRVLAGSRSVLLVASSATVLGVGIGTVVGLVAGYYRGWVEEVLMRAVDFLMAFPLLVIALLVLAVLGSSELNVILVVAIAFAPYNARVIRSATLTQRDRDFVAAARLRGESGLFTMFVEILPNIWPTIAVELTIRLALAIFTVATLSFLGLGIQPPTPDWGLMISSGRQYYRVAPWLVAFPALAIASLIVAVNLLADGLRR